MSGAEIITNKIQGIEPGMLFTYKDLSSENISAESTLATLSRLTSKGMIKRFEKGVYFKPKKGTFGEVPVKESQILTTLLYKNGKQVGYLTGAGVYNKMGLSTQLTNYYTIATKKARKPINDGRIKVCFVKTYCEVSEENTGLLQLLDAIKDLKNILGSNADAIISLIKIKFEKLSQDEKIKICELAIKYPPSVRAISGAILECLGQTSISSKLYNSLNDLSKYTIGIEEKTLPNKSKWKIKWYFTEIPKYLLI